MESKWIAFLNIAGLILILALWIIASILFSEFVCGELIARIPR